MKLYTEEQVRKAIELARDTHQEGKPYLERDEYDYSVDEVVDLLTPIELPSDEDAGIIASKIADALEDKLTSSQEAFFIGGFTTCNQWLRDKILNQNK